LIQDAIIRNIEIIGEASKKISSETKNTFIDVPWKEIAGMRDKLIHDYLGVDVKVVWNTIKEDIPALKKVISEIKNNFSADKVNSQLQTTSIRTNHNSLFMLKEELLSDIQFTVNPFIWIFQHLTSLLPKSGYKNL
jgi:hypothetical protein